MKFLTKHSMEEHVRLSHPDVLTRADIGEIEVLPSGSLRKADTDKISVMEFEDSTEIAKKRRKRKRKECDIKQDEDEHNSDESESNEAYGANSSLSSVCVSPPIVCSPRLYTVPDIGNCHSC